MSRVAQANLPKPPKKMLRLIGKAIADYEMIRDGDKLMLGLSGGKDSMTLFHALLHLKRHAPIQFELATLTIDPMMDTFEPEPLTAYVESFGVKHFKVSSPIEKTAKTHMHGDSFCSWCARMKRGHMYTTLREAGFGVLALAQHLDDLAESFLMSAFHEGRLNTMKAAYTIDAGDIRVIRPLAYVREEATKNFSVDAKLPLISENCPACFEHPTQRQHMKELLRGEESKNPHLLRTLLSAMRPLMRSNTIGKSG